jgi:hypothetical protein
MANIFAMLICAFIKINEMMNNKNQRTPCGARCSETYRIYCDMICITYKGTEFSFGSRSLLCGGLVFHKN